MGMNPDTNKFESLETKKMFDKLAKQLDRQRAGIVSIPLTDEVKLLRPDGTPVPEHWSVFKVGEEIVIKNYIFKVGYIGESTLLFEPVGPVIIGEKKEVGSE